MTNMKITFRKTIYACAVLLAIMLFSLGAGSCYMLSYSLGEDPNLSPAPRRVPCPRQTPWGAPGLVQGGHIHGTRGQRIGESS